MAGKYNVFVMKVSNAGEMTKAKPICSKNPNRTSARDPRDVASIRPNAATTAPEPTIAFANPSANPNFPCSSLTLERMKRYIREKKGTALLTDFIEGEFHTMSLKMFAELLRSEGWEVEFYSSILSVARLFKHLEKTDKTLNLICTSHDALQPGRTSKRTEDTQNQCGTKSPGIIVGSQLFKTKKVRDSLIDNETGVPLADFLASSF